jgi:hypothetical protein
LRQTSGHRENYAMRYVARITLLATGPRAWNAQSLNCGSLQGATHSRAPNRVGENDVSTLAALRRKTRECCPEAVPWTLAKRDELEVGDLQRKSPT